MEPGEGIWRIPVYIFLGQGGAGMLLVQRTVKRVRGSCGTVACRMRAAGPHLPEWAQNLPGRSRGAAMEPLEQRLMLSGTVLAPGAQVLSPDADGPSFVIAAPPVDMDFKHTLICV